ncbi:MAG: hypothetical protein GY792_01630 [Gammaproteobacteria bacterium]|nr:hypothetical protein [Gammaproteobacteria bacterium]
MDSSSVDLPGCEVESIEIEGNRIALRFSRAYIVKTMTGSAERTRWWQAGSLVFEGAEIDGDLPQLPAVCSGGDVGENIYTYRDMIPIPLNSRGRAHCDIGFKGMDLRLNVQAEAVHLDMIDRPRYIEHLRPA